MQDTSKLALSGIAVTSLDVEDDLKKLKRPLGHPATKLQGNPLGGLVFASDEAEKRQVKRSEKAVAPIPISVLADIRT